MNTGRDTVIEALNLARMGDIGLARGLLQKTRNQPDLEADACYGLGLLDLCENNIDNSEAYFCKATLLDPTHADAYYQLAKIADTRGDPVTATLYLKSALAQKPGHVMAAEALAEHGIVMESSSGSMDRSEKTLPARTNTGQWVRNLNKSGLNWKTLFSTILLVVLTLGATQEGGASHEAMLVVAHDGGGQKSR